MICDNLLLAFNEKLHNVSSFIFFLIETNIHGNLFKKKIFALNNCRNCNIFFIKQ